MQFVRLRVAGFKSFVQPIELALEPGLTGVVGPNGCGKSNIVEALRWVMGEGSARGLRGDEMDDVIFKGTASRPAFDLAEVTLDVRRPAGALAEIVRRIERGMGSSYRIDGREARARDVQVLFADVNSGARSAAIVGQGQIGALVDAKGTERRRLLEAAAGIEGLHARRHEAELKLRGAEGNLQQLELVLITRRQTIAELERQAKQAARYRRLGERIRRLERVFLLRACDAAAATVRAAEARLAAADETARSASDAVTGARNARDAAQGELRAAGRAEAESAARLARAEERLRAVEAERADLEAGLKTVDARIAETTADREREATTARDAATGAASAEADVARRREAIRTLAVELTELAQHVAEAAECAAGIRAEAGAARGALEAASGAAGVAAAAHEDALTTVRETAARLLGVESSLGELARAPVDPAPARERAARAEADARRSSDELAQLETRCAAALSAAAGTERVLAETRERIDAARAALAAAETRVIAAASRRDLEQARRDDLTRQQETLRVRLERLLAEQADVAARLDTLELGPAEAARAAARDELARIETTRARAAQRLAEAQAAWRAAAERRDAALQVRHAREAEAGALDALLGAADEADALRLEIDDGYAAAVVAALGDDLAAGLDAAAPAHWLSLERHDLPALPADSRPLADHVRAPAALAARLAQVGVAEPAVAAALQPALRPGQRLVSPDGGLWRWDGLVRRPGADDATACRQRQHARRLALVGEVAAVRAAAAAAAAELAEVEAALARERDAVASADEAVTVARGAAEAAAQERNELAARHALTTEERGRLAAQATVLAEEDAALTAALATLADGADAGGAPGDDQLERLRAELEALTGARDGAQAELERRRAAAREAAAARDRLAAEAAAAAAAAIAATRNVAELEARASEAAARRETLTAEAERLRAGLGAAEAATARTGVARELAAEQAVLAREAQTGAAAAATAAEHAAAEAERAHAAAAARRDELHARLAEAEAAPASWRERARLAETHAAELGRRLDVLAAERARLAARLAAGPADANSDELVAARAAHAAATGAAAAQQARLAEAEAELGNAQAALASAREDAARLGAELTRARSDAAQARDELARARGQDPDGEETPDEAGGDPAVVQAELERLRLSRERIGPVNLQAETALETESAEVQALEAERDDVTAAVARLRRAIGVINREGRERIQATFAELDRGFRELFVRLFGGGRARLVLVEGEDPLDIALEMEASPPGKRLQSLALLSGGEKALTATALIFALFRTRPAPLCVLDEVDAPLDDANVARLCDLMEETARSTGTRFLVVTHHPMTMARMDRLFGVTMVERGISRLVSVDLQAAEAARHGLRSA